MPPTLNCHTNAAPSTHTHPQPSPLTPSPLPPCPSNLPHIKSPLTNHPHQTPRAHDNRPSKRLPPPRSPKDKPLAREMRKSDHIRPDSELVERRLVDVVCSVEPDHAGEESPGAEGARREPGNVCGLLHGRVDRGRVVDTRGVCECAVGLDGV